MQKERLQQRTRLTLQVMLERGADRVPITAGDVWAAIAKRLPLEDDERNPQVAGPAGQVR